MHCPMLPKGTDFHLPSHIARFLISGYQPPCCLPTSSAMSDTSSRLSRKSHSCWGQATSTGALLSTMEIRRGTADPPAADRKSTRLNSSHLGISYAVFCLKKK